MAERRCIGFSSNWRRHTRRCIFSSSRSALSCSPETTKKHNATQRNTVSSMLGVSCQNNKLGCEPASVRGAWSFSFRMLRAWVQWLTWSEVRVIREGLSGEKLKLNFSGDNAEEEVVAGLPAMVDLRRGRERVETRFPSSSCWVFALHCWRWI